MLKKYMLYQVIKILISILNFKGIIMRELLLKVKHKDLNVLEHIKYIIDRDILDHKHSYVSFFNSIYVVLHDNTYSYVVKENEDNEYQFSIDYYSEVKPQIITRIKTDLKYALKNVIQEFNDNNDDKIIIL